PNTPEEDKDGMQDTDGGSDLSASGGDASASQMSQGTVSNASAETGAIRSGRSRPLPIAQPLAVGTISPATLVAMTLVISIPLSMLAGALIATLAFWMSR